MILYAALDVAIEKTAVCIVDREGAVVLETKCGKRSRCACGLSCTLSPQTRSPRALGRPLSEWLVLAWSATASGPSNGTRHVRAALSARIAKTDRKDARAVDEPERFVSSKSVGPSTSSRCAAGPSRISRCT